MRSCSICSGLTPAGDACLHCDAPLPKRRKLAVLIAATTGSVLLAACYGPAGKYRTQDPDQGSALQPAQPAGSAATPGSAAPTPLPQPG